jgi:hypothetical protein
LRACRAEIVKIAAFDVEDWQLVSDDHTLVIL